ncbi:substrate-binding periplasmic protein [Yunchengibacter salinarum]|uniref:substrate-binding periplasmic protein n=1 Tax=Yunchengibacter salinarum TaxID=3133399 RepID=UPI0035B6707B
MRSDNAFMTGKCHGRAFRLARLIRRFGLAVLCLGFTAQAVTGAALAANAGASPRMAENTSPHPRALSVVGPVLPPLARRGTGGAPEGHLVRQVRKTLTESGFTPDIRLMPWHRAMTRLENHPETLIFPLTRTPEREQAFYWLTRLMVERASVASLRGQPALKSIDDLIGRSARVGCSRGSVQCKLLRQRGLPEKQIFIIHEHGRQTYLKLALNHRIDYFVTDPAMMRLQMKKLGHSMSDFQIHFDLGHSRALYLAISRQAPAMLVEMLKSALPPSAEITIEESDQ